MIYKKCQYCDAPIVFIRMHTGMFIPCDPDKKVFVEETKAGGQVHKGFIPHWANCPIAKKQKTFYHKENSEK